MKHSFHPSILREYDIRGTVEQTLFPEDGYAIGLKFSAWLQQNGGKTVSVARDGRLSSPVLTERLLAGLKDGGVDVTFVHVGPTPMLYFSLPYLGTDAGIMVTASHNPKQDNGFKFALKDRPFFGSDILEMAEIDACPVRQKGQYQEQFIRDHYVDRLIQDYEAPSKKRLCIAWDSGNSAAGDVLQSLIKQIDADHVVLNAEIDGNFPAHHPDPTRPENLQQLIQAVKENSCDVGIAFDGDADRIGVVDERGRILWGDQLLIILAQDLLKTHPGTKVIADVKASKAFFDEIKRAGGDPVMWKTGHSHIKDHMHKIGASLAGEMSGHVFFADHYYGYDDALYAAIRLINVLQRSPLSIAEIFDTLPFYFNTPELEFPCGDDLKFGIVSQLVENLKKQKFSFDTTDGVRVQLDHGWWLIRASNTQPKLVGRCESISLEGLKELEKQMSDFLTPLLNNQLKKSNFS